MPLNEHLCLMAQYNQWMNRQIYSASAQLSVEALIQDKGAFFGSIFGTLNHIAVGDSIWLKRFAPFLLDHPELNPIRDLEQPKSLDSMLFSDLSSLNDYRKMLDDIFIELAQSISTTELNQWVSYSNTKEIPSQKSLFSLLMHVFNHQTHHRGQISTLLSQSGIAIASTDLVVLIPDK